MAERHFWPVLALLLLIFVLGAFLWYPQDSSERYFRQYKMVASPGLSLPWWQLDLAVGDELELPVSFPKQLPEGGRWFLEVLGVPVDSETAGSLEIGGIALRTDLSRGPRWHRVYLDAAPAAKDAWFTIRYRPESRDDANAKFRIWGRSTPGNPLRRDSAGRGLVPVLRSNGIPQPILGDLPTPIPVRHENVDPDHSKEWAEQHLNSNPAPFFRVGVESPGLGSRSLGRFLIVLSTGLLSLLLLLHFALYCLRHPGFGLGVLLISGVALWLRVSHLSTLSDLSEMTGNGLTVRDGVSWDSAAYFSDAVRIYSNEIGKRIVLLWPIGLPTFAAFLFEWTGVDLQVPKFGFAFLQALVGPLLFFCCLPVVRNKWLALLPLLTWSVFFRPMKYSYYFMAESLTMCLMIGWIAILYSRDPRRRDTRWLWIVLTTGIIFTLGSYTRDIVVTFLPAFLGMLAIFLGTTWRQRLLSAACGLGVVVGLWCATPILFGDKNFSLRPDEFLPITRVHYRTSNRFSEGGPGALRRSPLAAEDDSGLAPALRNVVVQVFSRPFDYVGERYAEAKRFWDPEERWTRNLNTNRAYREPVFARLVESELRRGSTYGALVFVLLSTALFGLVFSAHWRALLGLFLYVTLFHVLLFPGFTARPKAIFFPFMVLFASAGVFAFVEGFTPWLRRRIAARSLRG